jgi:hypothetical protein
MPAMSQLGCGQLLFSLCQPSCGLLGPWDSSKHPHLTEQVVLYMLQGTAITMCVCDGWLYYTCCSSVAGIMCVFSGCCLQLWCGCMHDLLGCACGCLQVALSHSVLLGSWCDTMWRFSEGHCVSCTATSLVFIMMCMWFNALCCVPVLYV